MSDVYVSGKREPGFSSIRQCVECGRKFDLFDGDDANEWFYGHDCEFVGDSRGVG